MVFDTEQLGLKEPRELFSILQDFDEPHRCYICEGTEGLQCHHIFHGNRVDKKNSERAGLMVFLCYYCHLYGIHKYPEMDLNLKKTAQKTAMEYYGWDKADWLKLFRKNYI